MQRLFAQNPAAIFNLQCNPLPATATNTSSIASVSASEWPVITGHRFLVGAGHDDGAVVTTIWNRGAMPVSLVYLEVVPWFMRVFWHTLELSVNERALALDIESVRQFGHTPPDRAPTRASASERRARAFLLPALDRRRSHHLELAFTLPARSSAVVFYEFERAFLKWDEFPPDAHRPFPVPSPVITFALDAAALRQTNASFLPFAQSLIHRDHSTLYDSRIHRNDSLFAPNRTFVCEYYVALWLWGVPQFNR